MPVADALPVPAVPPVGEPVEPVPLVLVLGPVVPETLALLRICIVALSQHFVFAAPVMLESDVPDPELVCAMATPVPTREASPERQTRRPT